MTREQSRQELKAGIIWAGAMLVLSFGAVIAHKLGYVDRDATTRVVIGMNGIMMAWYGNRMPKMLVPVPAAARGPRRVAAWSMVLSGLLYAGLWAFAPIQVATVVGTGAIIAGIVVTFGYCLSLRGRVKAS